MHTLSSRILLIALSGLALLGCTGEAEWSLSEGAAPQVSDPATNPEERSRLSTFQGLSSGLPANAKPMGIAHLDGTVYLVVDGALFGLSTGARAWTPVALPLSSAERVTSVTRIDLALYVTTTEGLLRLDWGEGAAVRLAAAPRAEAALVKKGTELLIATASGVFASKDRGATFSLRSSTVVTALVSSAAAERIFGIAGGALVYSDDGGAKWISGLVSGEVKALSAAGEFVLVETSSGTVRSDNYGNTFHPTSLGAQALGFGFSGKKAFAGTMSGVRVSDDGGGAWRDGNDGLPPSAQVSSLLVAGPAVVAATATQLFVAELF